MNSHTVLHTDFLTYTTEHFYKILEIKMSITLIYSRKTYVC